MTRGLCRRLPGREDAPRDVHAPRLPTGGRATPAKETAMTWQTPAATDLRFGFEITMYVAAR